MSAFAPRDEHWQDTDRQHSSDVIAPKAPHAIPQAVSLLITPHQHFPNHSAIGPLQPSLCSSAQAFEKIQARDGFHIFHFDNAIFELVSEKAAFRADALFVREEERSEEHTSELQSLMRLSYAVFCWT